MCPIKADQTGGLWAKLRLVLEMRLGLRVNLNVGDKLANGSLGTLKGWIAGRDKAIKYLFIDFDSVGGSKIGQATRAEFLKKEARLVDQSPQIRAMMADTKSNIVPIGVYTAEFSDKHKKIRIKRTMFPVAVAFSSTIHR